MEFIRSSFFLKHKNIENDNSGWSESIGEILCSFNIPVRKNAFGISSNAFGMRINRFVVLINAFTALNNAK